MQTSADKGAISLETGDLFKQHLLPTHKAMKDFLRGLYMYSRFEGRDGPIWGRNYSDVIVESRLQELLEFGVSWVSRYESRTANPIKFDSSLTILNPDAPNTELPQSAPSIGRIIHGQAW